VGESGPTASDIERQLGLWPIAAGPATLINHSENRTFRIDPPAGAPSLIRLHRQGNQTVSSIVSELAWIEALRADTPLLLPRPIIGRDGAQVQRLMGGDGAPRLAVAFRYFQGAEPSEDSDLTALFAYLGEAAARCHRHVEAWRPPAGFERPRLDEEALLAHPGLWGDWRFAPGVDAPIGALLARAEAALRRDLSAYGVARDRFGLIHADMRLANVIEHAGTRRIIDFDDMGFGWFLYDFGAAVSFMETSPVVPLLKAAWLDAYQRVRPLSAADLAMIDAMVLLRRFALLAWIGSHAETGLAARHAPHFAAGTAELAERYLGRA
jgi:Ser/Thr protein kinase RdoA (MazF antagonist)